jgi:hypothetical protein
MNKNAKEILYKNADEGPSTAGKKDNKTEPYDVKTNRKNAAGQAVSMDETVTQFPLLHDTVALGFKPYVLIFCGVAGLLHI